MTESDVSQLKDESLERTAFPASSACEFRVYFDPEVHQAIFSHASEDTSIEICGVVVGTWHKDDDGPFAQISNYIRCDDAASKNTEVTFTHQSWSQINDEMDSKYSNKRIVGWYHSHPDFGIFLSDRDMFIQEHFFCGPGQIAYVVDPVRKLEGVFEWRNGKAELMQRYWAGNAIISAEAAKSERPDRPALTDSIAAPAVTAGQQFVTAEESPYSLVTMLLSALCLFLVGMLLGEWRASKTQQIMAEGAVAHYGLWNLMQYGRSEQLEDVEKRISKSFDALTNLSDEQSRKFEGDERNKVRKQFQDIRKELVATRDNVRTMQKLYNVPPEQRELMAQVIVSHLGALSGFDARPKLPVPVPLELPKTPPPAQDGKVQPRDKPQAKQVPPEGKNGTPKPAAEEPASAGSQPKSQPSSGNP